MTEVSRETFAGALADLTLSPGSTEQLVHHWRLVCEWNQRTNLTAIRDTHEAAWLHYRDSLEALRVLPPGSVTDMGSGGGFPGIPIAIAEPTRRVMLVEPRRKRASFLTIAVARLGLENATVWTMRSEDQPPEQTAAVVTRATFSDPLQLQACLSWVAPGGTLIAFRSEPDGLEQPDDIHWYEIHDERRCLVLWRKPAIV